MTHMPRAGISMAEILIVIAVAAVLASVSMPAFNAVRNSAKSAACVNRVKSIGVAMTSYAQDNRGLYPIDTNGFVGVNGWTQQFWQGNEQMMDLFNKNSQYTTTNNQQWKRMVMDPADPNPGWFVDNQFGRFTEYAANKYMVSRVNVPRFTYSSMRTIAVPKPSMTYLVSDGGDPSASGGTFGVSAGNGQNVYYEGSKDQMYSLHQGKINLVFADLHSEVMLKTAIPSTTVAGTAQNDFWCKYP